MNKKFILAFLIILSFTLGCIVSVGNTPRVMIILSWLLLRRRKRDVA